MAGAVLGRPGIVRSSGPTSFLEEPMMKLLRDRRGVQMIEYVILVGVVALLAIAAFRKFGFKVRSAVDTQTVQVSKDDDE